MKHAAAHVRLAVVDDVCVGSPSQHVVVVGVDGAVVDGVRARLLDTSFIGNGALLDGARQASGRLRLQKVDDVASTLVDTEGSLPACVISQPSSCPW